MLRPTKAGRPANHEVVHRALKVSGQPMTAYELLDALRPQGLVAPPTVYRALKRLIRDGKVHRIESLNAFVACGLEEGHGDPAGFAICDACGDIEEFAGEAIATVLDSHARKRKFALQNSVLELHGRCGACRDQPSPESGRRTEHKDEKFE